jgi:hypothetical protein
LYNPDSPDKEVLQETLTLLIKDIKESSLFYISNEAFKTNEWTDDIITSASIDDKRIEELNARFDIMAFSLGYYPTVSLMPFEDKTINIYKIISDSDCNQQFNIQRKWQLGMHKKWQQECTTFA